MTGGNPFRRGADRPLTTDLQQHRVQAFHERARIVESVEIEGAGHWSHQEMPDQGCAAIEQFLKKVEAMEQERMV